MNATMQRWWPGACSTPVILQDEAGECGLACIAMVLGAAGHHVDLPTLRGRGGASARGVTLNTLMQRAASERLDARALRLEPHELPRLQLPAILHWNLDHFVVLAGRNRRRWIVHDPAQGRREYSSQELEKHFTGVALELVPQAGFRPREERQILGLRALLAGCRGLAPALGQVLLLSAMLQLFTLAMPFYTQLFLDDVLVHHDVPLMGLLAAGFALLTVARAVTEFLRAEVVLYLGNSIGYRFASNMCGHLLHLPLAWFSRRHLGDVVSRFGSLTHIRDFLSSGIVEVAMDSLMVLVTVAVMLFYSAQLTSVAALGVLVYALVRMLSLPHLRQVSAEHIHAGARENSLFMENVRAIQGIRLAGREDQRLALWQNHHVATLNAGVRSQRLGIRIRLLHTLIVGVEYVVLMLLGGLAVLRQELSVGMLMAFIGFKDQCYGRVFALVDRVADYRMLALHLERLADIALSEAEPGRDSAGLLPPHRASVPCLALRNICHRHDDTLPWLFRGIDLALEEAEAVAIIGPSGCGKSTLLRIAAGLTLPMSGEVKLRGTAAQGLQARAWRDAVAGVMQDDVLLSGSIADNITFFDPGPDRDRMREAAEQAAMAAEIEALPMQYETLVGSMGTALSGGQAQRLLLARALYRKPAVLVLDEATSHLDLATERVVNRSLRSLPMARLMVAHRPDSILLADRILALTPEGLLPVERSEFLARLAARPDRLGTITL